MKHSAKAVIQLIQTQMCFMKMELTCIERLLVPIYMRNILCVLLPDFGSISVNHMCRYPDFIGEAVETWKE